MATHKDKNKSGKPQGTWPGFTIASDPSKSEHSSGMSPLYRTSPVLEDSLIHITKGEEIYSQERGKYIFDKTPKKPINLPSKFQEEFGLEPSRPGEFFAESEMPFAAVHSFLPRDAEKLAQLRKSFKAFSISIAVFPVSAVITEAFFGRDPAYLGPRSQTGLHITARAAASALSKDIFNDYNFDYLTMPEADKIMAQFGVKRAELLKQRKGLITRVLGSGELVLSAGLGYSNAYFK